MTEELKVVGTSVKRIDGLEKVTGAAQYVDDIPFGPKLLHAKLKRSDRAHARIIRVDTTKAEQLPGVKAIVTGKEVNHHIGLYLTDRPIFAVEKVRYVGDPIAAVAATTEEIAARAVELIEVEYEELPVLLDPEEAMQPNAPLIHEKLGEYRCVPFVWPKPGTNISNHFKIRKGDVEQAFAEADYVYENTFSLPMIQHATLEPHISVAQVDATGKITLWSASQSPFAQRKLICDAFGLPEEKLRVISPYVGGGFGGKAGVSVEACVIPLAMKLRGCPIKLRMTREEEFYGTFTRQGLIAHFKTGVTKEGKLIAMENRFVWQAGAYTEYGVNITRAAGYSSSGPYDVPNVKTDSYCVYTNLPSGGPMRGFGMPEIQFCMEQNIDTVAQAIGMDPVEFRLKNAVKEGDITVSGMPMHPNGLRECIESAAEGIEWGKDKSGEWKLNKEAPSAPHKKRGKGISAIWKAPAMPPNPASAATIRINENGSAIVSIGAMEIGQGLLTVMAQMVAEELSIPVDKIQVNTVDTQFSPYEWQTVASHITWSTGNAVRRACQDIKEQVYALVTDYWDEPAENLYFEDGAVKSKVSDKVLPLADFAIGGMYFKGKWHGDALVGRGMHMPDYVQDMDEETGQSPRGVVHWTTGSQGVEIEVDTETGEITVLKISGAFDCGKAINPQLVEAQIEGGAGHGLSAALYEGMYFDDDGKMTNASFVDYKLATAPDVPSEIIPYIVEVPQDDGPWGARGVGEHTMIGTAPALANAIYDAVGVRVRRLPLSAENVWRAMRGSEE